MNRAGFGKVLAVGVAILGLGLFAMPADAGWWHGGCYGYGGCGCSYGCGYGWGGCGYGCGGCGYACGCGFGCGNGWGGCGYGCGSSCYSSCCSTIVYSGYGCSTCGGGQYITEPAGMSPAPPRATGHTFHASGHVSVDGNFAGPYQPPVVGRQKRHAHGLSAPRCQGDDQRHAHQEHRRHAAFYFLRPARAVPTITRSRRKSFATARLFRKSRRFRSRPAGSATWLSALTIPAARAWPRASDRDWPAFRINDITVSRPTGGGRPFFWGERYECSSILRCPVDSSAEE